MLTHIIYPLNNTTLDVPQEILSAHQQMPQHQGDVRSIVQQDLPSERIGGATSRCSVDESSPDAVWSHAVVQVYVPPAIWMQYPVKQRICMEYIFEQW